LAKLHELAAKCEDVYGPSRDIEWAFADGELYLLQCRAVTRIGSATPPPPAPDAPPPPDVVVQVPFFAGLDPDDVHAISSMFKERRFAAGDTIAKEGAGGAAFFVIDSGEAVVTVHGREVATLTRGDHFGEVALIDDGARSATVTAKTDVVCFGLTYWEFRPLIQGNARLAWNLLEVFANRLRRAQEG
jgi:signal-transduction protein with cAMP-binding, CBS, and nucleotidyltransferase domain